MRSLIILEVEHGEDTDALESIITAALIEADGLIKNYTVRVDLDPKVAAVPLDSLIPNFRLES